MQLTESQKNAVACVKSSQKHIVIKGYAGTGKTFLLKHLMENVIGTSGIVITAPTHQAKRVISEMSGYPASTIHSVFSVHPDTLEDLIVFDQTKLPDLSKCRWLIVEECSMVGGKLFEIIMRSLPAGVRILAMGDPAQLSPPDNEDGQISPFFTDNRFEIVELSEIVRNSGAIVEVAQDIRNGGYIYEKLNDDKTGVIKYDNVTDLLHSYFEKVQKPEDFIKCKFVAYTNKVVNQLNDIIRKQIYQTDEPVVIFEYLVMQEPLVVVERNEFGDEVESILLNNGEIIIVKEVQSDIEMTIELDKVEPFKIKYTNLLVESFDEPDTTHRINVIYDPDSIKKLNQGYAKAANEYKMMRRQQVPRNEINKAWKSFWKYKKLFTEVKPAPACTIHKSQGMTLEDIFIWTQDLGVADSNTKQQLMYVACTRPKCNVHFI